MPHVASPGIVHIAIESLLPAPSRIVAEDVMSLRGVNDELGPWLRMTAPRGWERQPINQWPRGPSLFASYILFLGLLPVGRHVFGMTEASQSGFSESSHSLLLRRWTHTRQIIDGGHVTRVVDHVSLEPRVGGLTPLILPVYRKVFAWRHRRLRSRYASAAGGCGA